MRPKHVKLYNTSLIPVMCLPWDRFEDLPELGPDVEYAISPHLGVGENMAWVYRNGEWSQAPMTYSPKILNPRRYFYSVTLLPDNNTQTGIAVVDDGFDEDDYDKLIHILNEYYPVYTVRLDSVTPL